MEPESFSRSIRDALDALGRIEAAGGRVVSATEQFGDDATGRMTRNILLAVAENERERAKAGFAAATASAVERGIHVARPIPESSCTRRRWTCDIEPARADFPQRDQ